MGLFINLSGVTAPFVFLRAVLRKCFETPNTLPRDLLLSDLLRRLQILIRNHSDAVSFLDRRPGHLRRLSGIVRSNFGICIDSSEAIDAGLDGPGTKGGLNMKEPVGQRGDAGGCISPAEVKFLSSGADAVIGYTGKHQTDVMETGNRSYGIEDRIPVKRHAVTDMRGRAGIGDERNHPGLRLQRRLCGGTGAGEQAESAKKNLGAGRDFSSVIHADSLLPLAQVPPSTSTSNNQAPTTPMSLRGQLLLTCRMVIGLIGRPAWCLPG